MNFSGNISTRQLEVFSAMPNSLLGPAGISAWAEANKPGESVAAFLEGPTFLVDGRAVVTDIPFGRILTVDRSGDWDVLFEYDGEPNGTALQDEHRLVIADYKRGLLCLDLATLRLEPIVERRNAESFKGLNDVIVAPEGALYFTDQGQTGLHDPTGRVYRLEDNRLDLLIDNGISPNGLVLSPSADVLYVAMTRDNSVWRAPLRADGSVSKVGRFCQLFGTSGPDGLAMTTAGELLVAHASLSGIFRYAPTGELIERLQSPVGSTVTNLTFDPRDPYRLIATESSTNTILTARIDVPGIV